MGEGADQTTQQQGEILERVNSRRHLQGRVQRVLGRRGRALQALVVVELEFGAAFAGERAVRDGGGVLDVGDGTSRLLEKQGDLFEREPVGVDREDVPPDELDHDEGGAARREAGGQHRARSSTG